MSKVMAEIPVGSPLRDAWEEYKQGEDYQNTRRWALHEEHVDGSLWAAFMAGYIANGTSAVIEIDRLREGVREWQSRWSGLMEREAEMELRALIGEE